MRESDVATKVMAWLEHDGWDCYPEAMVASAYGKRADIAAVCSGKLWLIEAKTSVSMSLLDQAMGWIGLAHYVSIAVPSRTRSIHHVAEWVLRYHGIGVLIPSHGGHVRESLAPRLNRSAHASARQFIHGLDPAMKKYTPGSVSAQGYSTPFSRTMDRVVQYVRRVPGCTTREIVDNVSHHYCTAAAARSTIPARLMDLRADQVRVERDGRRLRFYPVSGA